MGTNVEFIIAQPIVQRNKGGLCVAREDQIWLPLIVQGDHMFCHRQSGGTTFRGDQLKYDSASTLLLI